MGGLSLGMTVSTTRTMTRYYDPEYDLTMK